MNLQFILIALFNEPLHSIVVFIIYSWPIFDVAKVPPNLRFEVSQLISDLYLVEALPKIYNLLTKAFENLRTWLFDLFASEPWLNLLLLNFLSFLRRMYAWSLWPARATTHRFVVFNNIGPLLPRLWAFWFLLMLINETSKSPFGNNLVPVCYLLLGGLRHVRWITFWNMLEISFVGRLALSFDLILLQKKAIVMISHVK